MATGIKRRFKLLGDKRLIRKLSQLGRDVTSELTEILFDAAQPIKKTARANAPVGDAEDRLRQGIKKPLSESIIVVDLADTESAGTTGFREKIVADKNNAGVAIAPDARHFYGVFVEEGSKRHEAEPFLENAFDTNREQAKGEIIDRIRDIINRHTI